MRPLLRIHAGPGTLNVQVVQPLRKTTLSIDNTDVYKADCRQGCQYKFDASLKSLRADSKPTTCSVACRFASQNVVVRNTLETGIKFHRQIEIKHLSSFSGQVETSK